MTKNIKDCFNLAEKIKAKRLGDPTCSSKNVFLKDFDEAEKLIIEKGSNVRGRVYELWEPHLGIINIFDEYPFQDPDGNLALSTRQMKHMKEWARPIDVADPATFIRGMPDIATEINGFEVMQK